MRAVFFFGFLVDGILRYIFIPGMLAIMFSSRGVLA